MVDNKIKCLLIKNTSFSKVKKQYCSNGTFAKQSGERFATPFELFGRGQLKMGTTAYNTNTNNRLPTSGEYVIWLNSMDIKYYLLVFTNPVVLQ